MNLKLTSSQKQVLDWITEEWDDEWHEMNEMEVEGIIDFSLTKKTINALIEKEMILDGEILRHSSKEYLLKISFHPMTVLKFYNQYDYDQFVDPNGNQILH